MADDIVDEKYLVFKRQDFYLALSDLNKMPEIPAERIPHILGSFFVHDAVVIRRQDIFAPPALEAYAMGIDVALSLTPQHEPRVENLKRASAYFHAQASAAWDTARKLPD